MFDLEVAEDRSLHWLQNLDLKPLAEQTAGETYISSTPLAAIEVASEGRDILRAINSLPAMVEYHPSQVREQRLVRGNPWDHENPSGVLRRDISVDLTDCTLPARIYLPEVNDEYPLAALVYFHGGGFVLGSIDSYDNCLAQLAALSGCAIVSVEYRLAPEHRFPSAVYDTQNAFNWIHERASTLGLDASRLAIGGDSSGANLAAVACLLNRDQKLPRPSLQLLIYPCTEGNAATPSRKLFADGLLLTQAGLEWFHNHYISHSEDDDWRFRVLHAADHSNLPPAFVLTAGFDPLRDEGAAYAEKLRRAGSAVRHSCYTDMFHGFINFGTLSQCRLALSECATVLRAMRVSAGKREQEIDSN
ncbi:alpha/beta hydrolase [uncultured Microbulbifer sp.]|uniref:alpha/beta hydrolase n=1 Tax=uncultured Microbulbifer sp. TaxID=348147 RepID=UPI00261DE884|nr:alpha/beta hydrolase [uncultured Microbulbifer sp.]